MTQLFWIEGPWRGRLAISARPRGGDWLANEMKDWRQASVDTVVSLLTAEENQDLDLTHEEPLCRKAGMGFMAFPIMDRGVPDPALGVSRLLTHLDAELMGGKNVVVHCRQGVGRSGLIAAGILVLQEVDPRRAMSAVSNARGVPTPETEEQRAWITEGMGAARRR